MLTLVDPEWLSASHTNGLLLPSEGIEITLTAFIDSDMASRLNLGPRDLTCTLIIHTITGKDYFVAVSARYRRSCERGLIRANQPYFLLRIHLLCQ